MPEMTYTPEDAAACASAQPVIEGYVSDLESALAQSPAITAPSRANPTQPTSSDSYDTWCDFLWLRDIDYVDDCTYTLEQHQRPIPPRPNPRPVPPRPTPRPVPRPPSPVHPWVS